MLVSKRPTVLKCRWERPYNPLHLLLAIALVTTAAARAATAEQPADDQSETTNQVSVLSNGTDCNNRVTCTECTSAAPACVWSLIRQSCRPAVPTTTTAPMPSAAELEEVANAVENVEVVEDVDVDAADGNLTVRDVRSCPAYSVKYTRYSDDYSVTHDVVVTVSGVRSAAFRARLARSQVMCEQFGQTWMARVLDGGDRIECSTRQDYTLSGIAYFSVAVNGVPLMFDDKYDHYLTAYRSGCDFRRWPEAGCVNCLWDEAAGDSDDGMQRRYYCRWCTRNHLCTGLYQHCDVRKRAGPGNLYEPDNDVADRGITVRCPAVGIASVQPEYGPLAGGTAVRIGIRNHALLSVDKLVKVTVSGSRCLLPTASKDGDTVTCTVSPTTNSSRPDDGPVEVTYVSGSDKTLPALRLRSDRPFYFVDPEITHVRPTCGPLGGGTRLIIRGNFLDAGSSLRVLVRDNVTCEVVERSQNGVQCVLGPVAEPGAGRIRLLFDNYLEKSVPGPAFQYVGDPELAAGQAFSGIASGGTRLRVRGRNFACLKRPTIGVRYKSYMYTAPCAVLNDGQMECATPRIQKPAPIAPTALEFCVHAGFDRRLVQLSAAPGAPQNYTYTLHPDPVYTDFETDAGHRLVVVNGLRLDLGYQTTGSDLSVRFRRNNAPCNVTSVGPRRLLCRTVAGVAAGDEIVVTVGQNLAYEVHRKQEQPVHKPHLTILFAGITLVSLIITLVVAAVYCTKIALMAAEHRPVEMQSLCQQMQAIHSSTVTVVAPGNDVGVAVPVDDGGRLGIPTDKA